MENNVTEFANDVYYHLKERLKSEEAVYIIMCKNTSYNLSLHKHEQLGKIEAIKGLIKHINILANGYKIKLEE